MAGERTMIDVVANAMRASKAWPVVFAAGSAEYLARVAIEAMRQPSDDMWDAGRDVVPDCDDDGNVDVTEISPEPIWAAMIDAALAARPAPSSTETTDG